MLNHFNAKNPKQENEYGKNDFLKKKSYSSSYTAYINFMGTSVTNSEDLYSNCNLNIQFQMKIFFPCFMVKLRIIRQRYKNLFNHSRLIFIQWAAENTDNHEIL